MEDRKALRNDPCPCGSGLKFKACCLAKFGEQGLAEEFAFAKPHVVNNDDYDVIFIPGNFTPSAKLDFSKPITRVNVKYFFQEMFGRAEISYSFPMGRLVVLENEYVLRVERLKPGMRFRIESGEVATVLEVSDPKVWDPPSTKRFPGGLYKRRVVGRVKRTGFVVLDVVFNGTTVTTTPGHRFRSMTHNEWRPAGRLRAGELLVNLQGRATAVEFVSKPRNGLIELFNLEVEEFNSYFVGGANGGVWVHNGLGECGIPKPAEPTEGAIEIIGPIKSGDITTFQDFVDRSVVGDNLEGHELWQHANLKSNGLATERLSTPASQNNPIVALDRGIHQEVNSGQRVWDAATMSPTENINANAMLLRLLNAAPESAVQEAQQMALQHARKLGF